MLRQVVTHLPRGNVEEQLDDGQDLQRLIVRLQRPEFAEGEVLQAGHCERVRDVVDGAAAQDLVVEHGGGQVAFEADVGGAVVEDVGVVFTTVDVFADGAEGVGVQSG